MGKHKKYDDYYISDDNKKKEKGVRIDIDINVTKIMKYLCIAGVFIVAVIFGTKTIASILNEDYDLSE